MPLRSLARLRRDDDDIRSYQIDLYVAILCAGLWALVAGEIPNAVSQILGRLAHIGWVGMLIGGPLMVFVGMWQEPRRRPTGLWLQWGGNVVVGCALLTYVVAVSRTVYAVRASFAVFVVAGLVWCAYRLTRRDWRRVRRDAKVARRET